MDTSEAPSNYADILLLKEKFLGIKDNTAVRKPRRFTEKKFNFDWDAAEDTSASRLDSLIMSQPVQRHEGSFAGSSFGRRKFDDRHWSEKSIGEMEERDWRIFKEDYDINTTGGNVPNPIRSWDESGLPKDVVGTVYRLGYKEPTAIQRQAIPLGLSGRDFIGIAETGSGKTASFVLPMIAEIMKLPRMSPEIAGNGPYCLVLVPTRELANQIEQEAKKFLLPLGFQCIAIVGGHSIAEQSFNLRNGAEIIIATPGRLRDCIDQHVVVLNQCKHVVLDEADRMIDLNFEEDLNYILNTVPRVAPIAGSLAQKFPMHITMFSATMPPAVERLARTFLVRPVTVSIGHVGDVADTIEQRVELITENEKTQRLSELLAGSTKHFRPPIIVFVNQKRTVDYLCKRLESLNLRVVSLHGGKGQDQREAAISQLRSGQKDVLVATDVAGRGIDIKNVSLVINYDMAKTIDDYVHRVGRTGRAGSSGTAITFLTTEDSELFYDLRVQLQKSAKSIIDERFLRHEACHQRVKPGDRMMVD